MASDEQPKMARSKSSSLLEILSSLSSTLDPHQFINQINAIVNDLQDQLTSFSIDNDPQPRVKHPHGEQNMLLEVTQADGTWCKALYLQITISPRSEQCQQMILTTDMQ